jgi:predicted ribosome quality control (RQC) complex YloA/Tae2 family protein
MQSVDFTTLMAVCEELKSHWLPARIEQVYQWDSHRISLYLRTLHHRGWLTICWHPQEARICLGDAPPKIKDTFTFSDQLRHQLGGYVLTNLEAIAPWERVIDFQVAQRPGDKILWHLYVEVMGKYSNVILTDGENNIITVAQQINSKKSSFRTIQTGQPYQIPPVLTRSIPKLEESQISWQERISLIPKSLKSQLLENYRGLSPNLVLEMMEGVNLPPQIMTDQLTQENWDKLFIKWQEWLKVIATGNFKPAWTKTGYTVLGWGQEITPEKDVQTLINLYYTKHSNQEQFKTIKHQLQQKIKSILDKLQKKYDTFYGRLEQSDQADLYREKGDLLMANLHKWQLGMKEIILPDFVTGEDVKLILNPEKNAVQNAQFFYKQHQKFKRAKTAVEPLLEEVTEEINYLQQVENSVNQIQDYSNEEDLQTLREIKEELSQQNYIKEQLKPQQSKKDNFTPYIYFSPSGFEVWIGRNNKQNDYLTCRIAGDYDLWFHSQEIAGSHVLLRLKPGRVPEELDLQFTADLAAYYSRARQDEQVPVIYTQPKSVYKPKGAKPGMVIYKKETVLWGKPQNAKIN